MKPTRMLLAFFLGFGVALAQEKSDKSADDDSAMALDYGRFFEEMTVKVNAIDAELMQAESPKAAAIGVVRFAYAMRDMRERAEALDSKYPQAKGEMPPKLRTKSEAFGAAAQHLGQNGMQRVTAKFGATPEMKFAMRQLREFASGDKKETAK